MAPPMAKATTDSTDSTKELRFFSPLTVFSRVSPTSRYSAISKMPSPPLKYPPYSATSASAG